MIWETEMKILIVVVLAFTLLLSGCLSNKMQSWVGHHRDELVSSWGPPSQETEFSKGGRSMVYIQQHGYANQYGGVMKTCRMVFNTDSQGIIRSWAYYGC